MDEFPLQSASAVPLLQNRLVRSWITVGIIGAILISAVLIFLTVAGYGTATFGNLPANATIRVNGNLISGTSLTLRPGTYQVVIWSPGISPSQGTLHIGLFQHAVYKPTIVVRSPDAIASSLLGAVPGTMYAPQFTDVQWLDNDAWIVGILAPDDTALAMHYDTTKGTWSVAYSNAAGYPNSMSAMPTSVATYMQALITKASQDA